MSDWSTVSLLKFGPVEAVYRSLSTAVELNDAANGFVDDPGYSAPPRYAMDKGKFLSTVATRVADVGQPQPHHGLHHEDPVNLPRKVTLSRFRPPTR